MHVGRWLAAFVGGPACALSFGSSALGEPADSNAAIGAAAIKTLLTSQKRWTAYSDIRQLTRPHLGPRTADRSQSSTIEFMRMGVSLRGHAENDQSPFIECEFDATVRDDGFDFENCAGARLPMTYDPKDPDYPFKGRAGNLSIWFAPAAEREH